MHNGVIRKPLAYLVLSALACVIAACGSTVATETGLHPQSAGSRSLCPRLLSGPVVMRPL
jgi:hypothetical protein